MQNYQRSLFYDLQALIMSSNFYKKYYLLFKSLHLSGFPAKNFKVGRTGYSKRAILRALIIKNLEQIKTIPRLIEFLDAHPILTEMCGFRMGCIPDETQFYRFLKKVKNSEIKNIHHRINLKLVEEGVISKDIFIMDSKPIKAATRDNNLKNPSRNTNNKKKKPKRNPQATLGYYSHQKVGDKKKLHYYWGYRTHVIVSKEGISLVEITLPNNYSDPKVARRLIRKLKRVYGLKRGTIFLADAAYDERELYNFIIEQLKCKAFIPINPRTKKPAKTFGPNGFPVCEAGMEMKSNGTFKVNNSTVMKFRCPIKVRAKTARNFPDGCPVNHPKFTQGKQYGCTRSFDVTCDATARVPRDTQFYKKTYNNRTVVEQYFGRLGDREAEQTTHYKLRSVQNQMTIAHLSLSLVAYAVAILLKQPGKIRCYRTFPNECHRKVA